MAGVECPHIAARLSTFSHPSQRHARDILEFPARCSIEVAIAVPLVSEDTSSPVVPIQSILDRTIAGGFYSVKGPLHDLLIHPFLTTYLQTPHNNEGHFLLTTLHEATASSVIYFANGVLNMVVSNQMIQRSSLSTALKHNIQGSDNATVGSDIKPRTALSSPITRVTNNGSLTEVVIDLSSPHFCPGQPVYDAVLSFTRQHFQQIAALATLSKNGVSEAVAFPPSFHVNHRQHIVSHCQLHNASVPIFHHLHSALQAEGERMRSMGRESRSFMQDAFRGRQGGSRRGHDGERKPINDGFGMEGSGKRGDSGSRDDSSVRLLRRSAESLGGGIAAWQGNGRLGSGPVKGGAEEKGLWQPFSQEWLVEGVGGPELPHGGGWQGSFEEADGKDRKKKRSKTHNFSVPLDITGDRNAEDTGAAQVQDEAEWDTSLDSRCRGDALAVGGSRLRVGTHLVEAHAGEGISVVPALRTLSDWLGAVACGLPKAMSMYISDLQQHFPQHQRFSIASPTSPEVKFHRIRLTGLYTADQMRVIVDSVRSACCRRNEGDQTDAEASRHALFVAVSAWSIGSKVLRPKRNLASFSSSESCSQSFLICMVDDCFIHFTSNM